MSVPQDFSSLEVHHRRTDDGLKEVDHQSSGLLGTFSGIEAYDSRSVSPLPESYNAGSQRSTLFPPSHFSTANSLSTLVPDKEAGPATPAESTQRARRICGLPANGFWLLLATTLIIIAVAAGVSVGLYVHKDHTPASPTTNGNSLAATTQSSLASPSASSAAPDAVPRDPSSGLASVAWNDTKGTAQYRVYYQDNQNAVKEFAWNASSNAWEQTQTLGKAQAKTPIAAAVTGPQDFAFVSCPSRSSLSVTNMLHRSSVSTPWARMGA